MTEKIKEIDELLSLLSNSSKKDQVTSQDLDKLESDIIYLTSYLGKLFSNYNREYDHRDGSTYYIIPTSEGHDLFYLINKMNERFLILKRKTISK